MWPHSETSARAVDPGLFVARLGQYPATFDRVMCRAAEEYHHHAIGGNTGDPRDGRGDLGGETGGIGVGVTGAHPSTDKNRGSWTPVGVDGIGGQFVEYDVDVRAGHVVDRRVDAGDLGGQRRLAVSGECRFGRGAGVDRHVRLLAAISPDAWLWGWWAPR